MKIHILSDNLSGSKKLPALKCEHGLSMLIETNEATILCDMGASGLFLQNAREMGLDLNNVDFAFISHGHSDHTGGLEEFLNNIPDKKIYASQTIFEEFYFSGRRGYWRAMSTDHSLPNNYPDRFIFTNFYRKYTPLQDGSIGSIGMQIGKNIAIVGNSCHKWSKPYGNCYLTKSNTTATTPQSNGFTPEPDDFTHEQVLVINTPEGLVIISSCSHCGAINIMESCIDFTGEKRIAAFIGGLHFIDSPQVIQEIETFTKEFNEAFYTDINNNIAAVTTNRPRIITGHCTSDPAKELLKERIPGIEFFHTGATILV
ncbi:MAG: MBL fold metallo-hydrolase [Bacteroidales bacterium]|nr:MBL fold metallo-hydrolase [Bacteroidales bacterium]